MQRDIHRPSSLIMVTSLEDDGVELQTAIYEQQPEVLAWPSGPVLWRASEIASPVDLLW